MSPFLCVLLDNYAHKTYIFYFNNSILAWVLRFNIILTKNNCVKVWWITNVDISLIYQTNQ